MANLKNIVYLTKTQYESLVANGSITVGGVTYTYDADNDYRVKYEEPSVPVKGVQVAGTDLTPDAQGKVNLPIAALTQLGMVKPAGYGVNVNPSLGNLIIDKATDAEVAAKSNIYKPIVPANLDKAIMEGLGNNSLTWSSIYKAAACATIGAATLDSNGKIPVSQLPIYDGSVT